jgi:dephospho-CoA kinase
LPGSFRYGSIHSFIDSAESGSVVKVTFVLSICTYTYYTDADTIAHSVYTPGSQAIKDIVSEFGPELLQPDSEEIDRKKLGSIVFADRSEMAVG